MKTLDEMRREAEAIKGTEQELEGLVPVKMTVSPNLGIVYSLRFSTDEMKVLRDAAKNRGMKLSEFIREGAMALAAEAQDQPTPRDAALREARDLVGAAAKALDKLARP
jgi:hypothetical protein